MSLKKVCLVLVTIFAFACFIGCGKVQEISINSYVNVEFEGYDTFGKMAEYEFDARQMLTDYSEQLGDVSKKDLEELLFDALEVRADNDLTNGDTVSVSWDIDEDDLLEFEEENKVKLIYSDFTIEISGLTPLEEIDINSYINVSFIGYNTRGAIDNCYFNVSKVMSEHSKALKEASEWDVDKLFDSSYQLDKFNELSNGDKISVTWSVNKDEVKTIERAHGVKFVYSDFSIDVAGLTELDTMDPFENLIVYYEGYAPSVRAYVNTDNVNYYGVRYTLDKNTNLSNGDVVTVTVSYRYGDFVDYCISNFGAIPTATTKEYVVSGCASYVTSVDQIPAKDIESMKEYIKSLLEENVKTWSFPESYCGMTYMGNIFASVKDFGFYSNKNALYFMYKVDVDSIKDGAFSYYYFGSIFDLIMNTDGTLSYNLENIIVPKKGRYSGGIYFTHNGINYDGYRTYDEMYNDKIPFFLENYNVTDNVDKTIITKQTHVPRDYSVVTAELKLGADCFTYKWYQGSYYVSGLTEKGLAELKKYSASDYVSIQLPEVTEDGITVEGMYSSDEEGGYSFTSLMSAETPCFKLVCANTYKTFYGFCNDYSYNSTYSYKLRTVELNKGLTKIMAYAFRNCPSITSIVIPEGTEEIWDYAFYKCTNLKKITIPTTVTVIGKEAFRYCSALEIDNLDISTVKMGTYVFDDVAINTITISTGDYAPVRNSLDGAIVKKLVIKDGVTKIPDYALEDVSGIIEITIPATVMRIGIRAFANMDTLEEVVIKEGLEVIDQEAFYDCDALKDANIPSTVLNIYANAFSHCEVLTIPSIEVGNMKISKYAFEGVTVNSVTLSSNGYVPDRTSSWSSVYAPWSGAVIKKITIASGVTSIPNYAFESAKGYTELVIPDTVTSIGEYAFKGNDALKTVTLPAALTSIGTSAFEGCTYLSINSLKIDNLTVGLGAFSGATLQEVILGSDTYADIYTVGNASKTSWSGAIIKKLTIKDGVTKIPDYAFGYLDGVTELVIPATVKTIGKGAFINSKVLKTVTLNDGLEEIGMEAFKNCTNLKILNVPSTVTKINREAFYGCSYLLIDKLNIKGMTIDTYAFYQATINEIVMDGNDFTPVRYKNWSWSDLSSSWSGAYVKKITITNNVTELPKYAFEGITSIEEVIIPESVTKIGENAFAYCSALRKITIPASVTELEKNVFLSTVDLIVITPADSMAQKYAADNGITVQESK